METIEVVAVAVATMTSKCGVWTEERTFPFRSDSQLFRFVFISVLLQELFALRTPVAHRVSLDGGEPVQPRQLAGKCLEGGRTMM